MYCSHCGKKVAESMLFCPFCGTEIVIPEQDDAPIGEAAPASDAPTPASDAPAPASDAPAPASAAEMDAAAELLDWNLEREIRREADVWARPEAPANSVPPKREAAEKPAEEVWRTEITRKKQAAAPEKKPPEMKRGGEPPVRLQGAAPTLNLDVQGGKPHHGGKKSRKSANTLVPPKTMDPNNIFMDDRPAAYDEVDPYDDDSPMDDLAGGFAFEEEDDGSFFMRHLRGIVGLALFVILLLLIVIYAFSRPGQQGLARMNIAWSRDAYSTLGYESYQAGRYGEAGLYYERALQRDPNSYSFASSAAMAYLEAGETEKAAAMLKRCAQIDPGKLEPYVYLLKLYPDAASRPWDITQLLQQGYQRTGDARLNVTG